MCFLEASRLREPLGWGWVGNSSCESLIAIDTLVGWGTHLDRVHSWSIWNFVPSSGSGRWRNLGGNSWENSCVSLRGAVSVLVCCQFTLVAEPCNVCRCSRYAIRRTSGWCFIDNWQWGWHDTSAKSSGKFGPFVRPIEGWLSGIFSEGATSVGNVAGKQVDRARDTAHLEHLRISLHEASVATGDLDSQREKVDTTHSGSFGRPLGANQPRKTVRVRRESDF